MSWFDVRNIVGFFKGGVATTVNETDRLPVDDLPTEFWRIKNKRFRDNEEVRHDVPVSLINGSIYTAVNTDGTATSSATWTIIRVRFDSNENPSREQIRFNKSWDDRANPTNWT